LLSSKTADVESTTRPKFCDGIPTQFKKLAVTSIETYCAAAPTAALPTVGPGVCAG
jgi:hypothetical protein